MASSPLPHPAGHRTAVGSTGPWAVVCQRLPAESLEVPLGKERKAGFWGRKAGGDLVLSVDQVQRASQSPKQSWAFGENGEKVSRQERSLCSGAEGGDETQKVGTWAHPAGRASGTVPSMQTAGDGDAPERDATPTSSCVTNHSELMLLHDVFSVKITNILNYLPLHEIKTSGRCAVFIQVLRTLSHSPGGPLSWFEKVGWSTGVSEEAGPGEGRSIWR